MVISTNTSPSNRVLETVEFAPREAARAAVIWLHGLGADGHDFAPLAPQLLAAFALPTRLIFPHAPQRPVTLHGGYVMRAWFDVFAWDTESVEDEIGLQTMTPAIEQLIEREAARGIPYENIALAGFSQGGSLALHVGIRFPRRLRAVIGLSTWLSMRQEKTWVSTVADTPIFLAHGVEDAVVPYPWGVMTREALQAAGCAVTWREYAMGHTVCPQEINDLVTWMNKRGS